MKCLFIILDGLGDRPVDKLQGLTPLEAAETPTMDFLVKEGICGMLAPLGLGFSPESGPAHFEIFGYPYKNFYPGRGALEALGVWFDLKEGDLAFRVNFATYKDGKIIDRRAGRIKNVEPFEKDLTFRLEDVDFILKAGTEHRGALILRGRGLSSEVSDSDPRKENLKPLEVKALTEEAKFTAQIVNKYLRKAHQILEKHPLNQERKNLGLPLANFLLLRGPGVFKKVISFQKKFGLKSCCIAGAGLYKGIGRFLGMDIIEVKGATGGKDTKVENKILKAKDLLEKYDFVWIHIKATDLYGHDGDCLGKKIFLEKVDRALEAIKNLDCLKVITGDHSTPCLLRDHSGDPVPIVFSGKTVRKDENNIFGERSCARGGLGRIEGVDLMPEILNLMNKAKIIE